MNKTVKAMWVMSGILVFLWTIFWFIRVSNEPGIVGNVIKYTFGLYLVILYIIVSTVYLITKSLNRKWKRKR